MIDKLIKLIEKSANDRVDGTCSAVSAHFCKSTDCSECVFDEQKVGVLLGELKELQAVKKDLKDFYGEESA